MKRELMTQEGYDELIMEFKYLNNVEKPRVNSEKQVAAEQGDRSENAEYHAAKEKLRHINRRLFYLNSMIEKASIVHPQSLDHSRVHFGSSVTLLDFSSDEESVYTICGVLESEVENGLISFHSPLAKAMMGKIEGDEFEIVLPSGKKDFEIIKLEYIGVHKLKKIKKTEKSYIYR